jgi:hypothetical protein
MTNEDLQGLLESMDLLCDISEESGKRIVHLQQQVSQLQAALLLLNSITHQSKFSQN